MRAVVVVGLLTLALPALGQGTKEDFARAAGLRMRYRGKATNLNLVPRWLEGGKFWYARGKELLLVDPKTGTKSVVADPKSLPGTGGTLPALHPDDTHEAGNTGETRITFVNKATFNVKINWVESPGRLREYSVLAPGKELSQNTFVGHAWLVTKEDGTPLVGFVGGDGPGVAEIDGTTPRRRRRPRNESGNVSPDGKWRVEFAGRNAVLVSVASGEKKPLTDDGADVSYYGPPVRFSPDSKFVTLQRIVPGQERKIPIVSSSPKNQTQPTIRFIDYDKPGDRLTVSRPRLFSVERAREIPTPELGKLLENPFEGDAPEWSPDSSRCYVRYNQRGHQVYRIVEIEAATGKSRALIEEKTTTFIDWTNKVYFQPLYKTGAALWMSERDGWNHLYLLDLKTGAVKKQLTKGEWVVRGIERVDEGAGEVLLRVCGLYLDQDPYHIHYAKVSLKTGKLTPLTDGDGTHSARFSPDFSHFVASYSRVDSPPVHELRRTSDGKKLLTLESADISALTADGWRAPERFVAKGRDGKTDIWGIIHRPLNFDKTKKYPVIENIYAGPHGAHVPKLFTEIHGSQELAELGFIVVQIDGMGTNWRSKAFHDVCWKNIADGGFADRKLWMQAAAKKYPELDISRVGIYGTSAGGQNALHAMLLHGEFYKAGVADCGCVDNRMDKVWWNEQWMGFPIEKHYAEQSCVTLAPRLSGKLFLLVGEEDTNVDPSSTMQVVDALIRADKDFDLLVAPNIGHGVLGLPYARRRMHDFFIRSLLGVEPRR
jgi:dipeptidyl aminopeptidase/acylaminoacyl peptidase